MNEVSRACFYHLRALRHIRPAITAEDANMIACSVVGAWLDYANAVLYGVSKKNISRLQRIQNALARCVVDSKLNLNSNASLQHLHWLPVDYTALNLKLPSSHFLPVHLPPVRISTRRSLVIRCPAHFVPKILACLLFPVLIQSLVRVRFASLRLLFLIPFLRIYDHAKTFQRFVVV